MTADRCPTEDTPKQYLDLAEVRQLLSDHQIGHAVSFTTIMVNTRGRVERFEPCVRDPAGDLYRAEPIRRICGL